MIKDFIGLTSCIVKDISIRLRLCCMASCAIFLSCADSSSPSSVEIFPTKSPTIFDEQNINLTSSSSTFYVEGTCDTEAYGLVYSIDEGATWKDVPNGCINNGTYEFSILVVQVTNLQVRSKTQFAFTDPAQATIRLVLPPNSPLMQLTAASSSPISSFDQPRMAFTMPWSFSGERLDLGGSFKIDTHATGVVYAQ